jgi:glyoxylase-like metal-dependent hydrolase (beta-lactamase superfamily II)
MKRALVLGGLVAIGALSMGVAAWQGAVQPQTITVDKVKDNLFMLRGGGGNTAVFIRSDGVVVVDSKNPGWGQPLLDKIKELTPKPVTTLINTHTHGDHVSGNVEFPASVEVIVQENTRTNMQRMEIFAKNANRGMATRTFADRMTIGNGADAIDLFYFGPGHTNGDAWILFRALRTVHTGDIFATKGLPLVDGNNGGSVLNYPETLRKAHAGIPNADTIINGHHATTTTWADLKEFAEFNQDFLTWAQAQLKAGKTAEQAAAEWKVPEKYQGYSQTVSNLFGGLPGRIQRLAEEMKSSSSGQEP